MFGFAGGTTKRRACCESSSDVTTPWAAISDATMTLLGIARTLWKCEQPPCHIRLASRQISIIRH